VNTEYVNVTIKDRSGNQKAFYSTSADNHPIVDLKFDTLKAGGCNQLSIMLARDGIDGACVVGDLIYVEVLTSDPGAVKTRYWYGEVTKAPDLSSDVIDATDDMDTLTNDVYVTSKTVYAGQALILHDSDPTSKAQYGRRTRTAQLQYTKSGTDALQYLAALLAKDKVTKKTVRAVSPGRIAKYEATGLFFSAVARQQIWKYYNGAAMDVAIEGIRADIDTPETAIPNDGSGIDLASPFVVADLEFEGDKADDAIKKLADIQEDVDYGVDQNGLFYFMDEDTSDVAEFWASVEPIIFSQFIYPRGNVRITDNTTAVEYHFGIQRVTYQFSKGVGFSGTMELGDQPEPRPSDLIRSIRRLEEGQKSGQISLVKIDHTRAEEFAQQALSDGRKNGFLNHAQVFLANNNWLDKTRSMMGSQSLYNNQIVGPFGYAANRIYTLPIETGKQVDSVRLHTYTDEFGRITFDQDTDFDMFFDDNTSPFDWRLNQNGHGAEQSLNTGSGNTDLYYREGHNGSKGTQFQLPANHEFRIRLRITSVNTGRPLIIDWGRQSGTVRNWLEIDMSDATHLRVVIKSQNGGAITTHATLTDATASDPCEREIQVLYGAVSHQYTVRIYDTDGTTVLQTSAAFTSVPGVPAGSRIRLNGFRNSTDGTVAQILWFEPQQTNLGNNLIEIARDGGNDFTSWGGFTNGIQHDTIDLSTIDPGTQLVVRILNAHPGRVQSWALSW
jgi:hypothetical protein